jgi:hypothetical protein
MIKKCQRRETFAEGIDYLFQADLADMRNLTSSNDGNSDENTSIQVTTVYPHQHRHVFAVHVRRAGQRQQRFDCGGDLKKNNRRTRSKRATEGQRTKLYNVQMQDALRKYDVGHYSSFSDDIKVALVEKLTEL